MVALPGILGDIIRELLADEKDIEVVGEGLADSDAVSQALKETPADVVIFRCDDVDLPDMGNRLLAEHAFMRVLGVAADGRRAFLYELRPQRIPLGEVSSDALIAAIRSGRVENGPSWRT